MPATWLIRVKPARIIPGLFACALLAACIDTTDRDRPIPDRAAIFGGTVTVVAPEGYCLDTRGSELNDDVSVLLFASCASLGASGARMPQARAILTATIRPDPLPAAARSPEQLAAFFNGDKGRALLSRTGSARDIVSLEHGVWRGGVFWLRATEARAPDKPFSPVLWHAVLEVAGKGMNISAYPAASGGHQSDADTRELLLRFIDRTRHANRAR